MAIQEPELDGSKTEIFLVNNFEAEPGWRADMPTLHLKTSSFVKLLCVYSDAFLAKIAFHAKTILTENSTLKNTARHT